MIRIALTGSIGMGKSTVAAMFERAGVPVFDADAVVRQLQGAGGGLVEKIAELFPGCVRCGTLDRECLAQIVLADPAKLAALEQLVHPAVRAAREQFIADHADAAALVFEIPLLLETGGQAEFDKVVVVSAPPDVQRGRVLRRTGMTVAKLDAILARQMPDAEKRARADFVVDTGADLSTTESQVGDILACLGIPGGR
ncbi:dephospho-CoA kinase [Sphingomonas sp.]|uniref:dephospho-CoA kinase n=1 Tax=Sphingomonas sp. TaxID=28214 RepID=UPI00389D3288